MSLRIVVDMNLSAGWAELSADSLIVVETSKRRVRVLPPRIARNGARPPQAEGGAGGMRRGW
ncbi:hypothetical protein OJF2_02520 [Aquisphaera giovannonii]|uniref:Uncharacterized protein n=1 Tax=Aquisphaera giovannonii TaxID=406548 RepID=A0A5B9VV52_9BACT|nr:hypothetical protein OJF2_02520 [Aquisphaera giovannonii]